MARTLAPLLSLDQTGRGEHVRLSGRHRASVLARITALSLTADAMVEITVDRRALRTIQRSACAGLLVDDLAADLDAKRPTRQSRFGWLPGRGGCPPPD